MAVAPNRSVRRSDRVFHGVVAAGLAVVFAVSLWPIDVASMPATFGVEDDGLSMCVLRRLTGMPCPTCGMTRSFRAMGQGAPAAAVNFHPLGPILYGLLLAVMVRSAGVMVRGRTWLDRTARGLLWAIPVLATATLVVWGVRLTEFYASGTGEAAWHASLLGRLLSPGA